MSITKADYEFKLKVTEDISLALDSVENPTIVWETPTSASGSLSPSSSVPCTKVWGDTRSLVANTDTIDLQNLSWGDFSTDIDFTGLKVQFIKIIAASTNTDTIIVADGAANGYELFGDASGQLTIPPGGVAMYFGNDSLDDVAAADSEIDVTSAGDADATYDILIVAG